MPQPVLRTERLLMVPLADRHFELEVELDGDAEVLRYLFGRARTRDEVTVAHARRVAAAGRVDGLGFWMAFRDDEDGEFVGLMMLPPADGPRTAELGYRLMRRAWRQGLASEASRELLRYAFEEAGQERVVAQTMAVNVGSRGVMAKVGLRHIRTFHEHFEDPLPGTEQGEVEYAITRAEWAAALH
ncbi:GNAT family N-acetyltransferase [Actinoplanes rectilineatus]|uniref:GNAT family N-acetyltransferase n=1 Tax=Actinoplanes rectilineatus TaxID=113571 RepID=UPI0005F28E84|nr:GNAT family N-acetyltransferase [Actinoplanes rectilineatus]